MHKPVVQSASQFQRQSKCLLAVPDQTSRPRGPSGGRVERDQHDPGPAAAIAEDVAKR